MAEQTGPTDKQLAQLVEAGCRFIDGHVIRKNKGYVTVVPWGQSATIANLPYTIGDKDSAVEAFQKAIAVVAESNAKAEAAAAKAAAEVQAEDAALDALIAAATKAPAAKPAASQPVTEGKEA